MSSVDLHVISERVAEVVNRKLSAVDRRLAELESKVARLELEVGTVKSQAIESIVRSVLTVKLDDVVAGTVAKASASFADQLKVVYDVAAKMESAVRGLDEAVSALKELPGEVSDAIKNTKPEVNVELTPLTTSLTKVGDYIRGLADRIASLEKKVDEMGGILSKAMVTLSGLDRLAADVEKLMKEVEGVKETLDYVREVSSVLEKRIKMKEETDEEEEER